jgi:glycosyltransferase involved in cell wall biosynthesis
MEFPLISAVITTQNEEKNIKNCLESIKRQTYPVEKIEIIVVDNDSSDATKEIAAKYTDKIYNIGPERSAQRNYGIIEIAKGDYVMYLDADMSLSSGVIERCVEKLRSNDSLIAFYISEVVTGKKYWSRVRRFERSFYDATAIDCVRFFQRDKFIKVGGFDLSMTGPEDWDLDKKIRQIGQVGLVKEPIYHNEAEFDLKRYLAKKGYYAKSFDAYIAKWGSNDPDVKKQFGLWYRYFGVFLENGKWKKFIFRPDLILGMYWLRGLVGLKYLLK